MSRTAVLFLDKVGSMLMTCIFCPSAMNGLRKATIAGCHFLVCVAVLGTPATFGQGRSETIAKQGDPVTANRQHFDFESLQLNNLGQVAYVSNAVDNLGLFVGQGVFHYEGSGSTLVAHTGQATGDGDFGNVLSSVQLNNSGQLLFKAEQMTGTSGGLANDTGVFLYDGANLVELAREGNATSNGAYGEFSNLQLNNDGDFAFVSTRMTGTSSGLLDDEAIFYQPSTVVLELAREGDPVPGFGINGNLGRFLDLNMNSNNHFAFRTDNMSGTSGGITNDTGVFLYGTLGLDELAVEGDPAPGGGNYGEYFEAVTMNGNDQVAFQNYNVPLGVTDDALFLYDGSAVRSIAREGETAPGGGQYFRFGAPHLNNSGDVLFVATVSLGDNGIFLYDGTSTTSIARRGESTGNGNLSEFGSLLLNNSGHMVFWSDLMIGTQQGLLDDGAAFITDGLELIEIRREGDLVSGRTIAGRSIDDPLQLNKFGQVVLNLVDDNGGGLVELWTPDLHWRYAAHGDWSQKSNWTLTTQPDFVHDVFIDSDADVTVGGPTAATVRSLQLGGGNGLVTLNMQAGGSLTTSAGVSIMATGTLTGTGSLTGPVTNDGTILAQNLTFTSGLTNQTGVIEGNGRIAGGLLTNQANGAIRAGAGEVLLVDSSSVDNFGVIEVIGGEARFTNTVTNHVNTGLITGHDATMRFQGGVLNQGSMGLSFGVSDVFGDIDNDGGTISLGGDSEVTFYDDIMQNGVLEVATVGTRTSSAVVFGAFSGAGGFIGGGDLFLLGDLRPGNSPASVLMDGNLFLGATTDTFVELGGMDLGQFDQLVVTGDLALGGDLSVGLINGFQLTFNDQFLIADVGGQLSDQFLGLSEGDLVGNFGGMDLFITYGGGNGNGVALFTAIPEPGAVPLCLLMLGASVYCGWRRRSRAGSHVSCRS